MTKSYKRIFWMSRDPTAINFKAICLVQNLHKKTSDKTHQVFKHFTGWLKQSWLCILRSSVGKIVCSQCLRATIQTTINPRDLLCYNLSSNDLFQNTCPSPSAINRHSSTWQRTDSWITNQSCVFFRLHNDRSDDLGLPQQTQLALVRFSQLLGSELRRLWKRYLFCSDEYNL